MNRNCWLILLLALSACQAAVTPGPRPAPTPTTAPAPGKKARVVAYYPSWAGSSRRVYPADLPAERLDGINYAFALPTEGGECGMDQSTSGPSAFAPLRGLRERHPGLELMISIAGYGYDRQYKTITESAESMGKFAASCVGFMERHGFDGIDLDWEYPKLEQKAAFTALLAEFRRQLDQRGEAAGRRYRLTIAGPAGYQLRAYDLPAILPLLDWINVMTYDFYGAWSAVTGFNAPLFQARGDPQQLSCDSAIAAYLAGGAPPEKLLLGIPFYGRGWTGAGPQKDGLFQPYEKVFGKGSFDYREIKESYLGSFERHWDETAQAPWLYDPATRTIITYDDPQSAALKAAYARDRGLGGVMIWQIAGDDAEHSLLDAILKTIH